MFEHDSPGILRLAIVTVAFSIFLGAVLSLPISLEFFKFGPKRLLWTSILSFSVVVFLYNILAYHQEIWLDLKQYAVVSVILFILATSFSFGVSAGAKFDNKTFHPNAKRCAGIFQDDMTNELRATYIFSKKSIFDRVGKRIFLDRWLTKNIVSWQVREIQSGTNNANIKARIISDRNDRSYDIICYFTYWNYADAEIYPNRLVQYVVSGDDRTHLYSSTFFRPIRK